MHTPSRIVGLVLLTTCLIIAAAAIVMYLYYPGSERGLSCSAPRVCPGDSRLVEDLPSVPVTAVPAWDEPATVEASPRADPELVEIHLDVSSPMAGYLPADGEGDLSVFQLVAQNAAQHLARVFGSAAAPVRWVGVGHDLRTLGARPQIVRSMFNGRSTELALSMERMLGDFRSGRAEAAALVSDLMATGDVTGPLTLFGALGEWLESPDVRSGAFHVGLFGLKADYWGVRVPGCAARSPLGCRFDELRRRWVAIETVQRMPVYVLVLGRGAARVVSVMESLQATVDELNRGRDIPIETQWELLTRAAVGHDATLTCRAGALVDGEPGPQYALRVNERQEYCCQRDDPVTLFCDVEGGFQPAAARATWVLTPAPEPAASAVAGTSAVNEDDADGAAVPATGTEAANEEAADAAAPAPALPPGVDARIDGTRLVFDFACSAVRCGPPTALGLELRLEATGTVAVTDAVGWRDDWSTQTGAVGRKVAFAKLVLAQGVPLLVASGYHLD